MHRCGDASISVQLRESQSQQSSKAPTAVVFIFVMLIVNAARSALIDPLEALAKVDWLTLVIGIILGIPVAYGIGILTHMHAPKVVQFLENRKLLRRHKTRQRALAPFNRIKSFHDELSPNLGDERGQAAAA